MYAPVATRFHTYNVHLDPLCQAYAKHILALPDMVAWRKLALKEEEEVPELEVEF